MSEDNLIQTTKYYNSKEADKLYYSIWGSENIHIGIYENSEQSMEEASRNVVRAMVKKIPALKKNQKILDIGSGYGGTARFLAKKYKCTIDCLNISEQENERNRKKNKEVELEGLISVTTGNFEKIPFDRETYDIVWSQDALLYSNKKEKVFRQIARVLKPGGRFIFTDLMQSDDCPKDVLKKVCAGLHLEEMGSVKFYERLARRVELERVLIKKMPEQLAIHYTKVLERLSDQYSKVSEKCGEAFVNNMMTSLQYGIDAGEKGYLTWGILQFQKRNS